MLMPFVYVFAFVFVLSLIVVIHEGGHFFVARLCGVKVTDFSIGFGPKICGWVDKKGTQWKICLIPLGGYVKMLGDTDAASAQSDVSKIKKEDLKYAFPTQKLWKKMAIIAAGPGMNYLFAFVLLAGMIYAWGEAIIPPIVGEVLPDSPAMESGLQKGDRLVSINEQSVERYTDVLRIVRLTAFDEVLNIEIDRDGLHHKLQLKPRVLEGFDYPLIGIRPSSKTIIARQDIGLFEAFQMAGRDIYKMTADTLTYLGQILFKHRSATELRGPLGIAEASGDALLNGFESLLMFIVQISVAVGFMNLLPIPLLDGGHLMFYFVEMICRRPVSEKWQNRFFMAGLALLLLIFAYTMFLDVPRIMERVMQGMGL